jgi:hypothetical protein
VILYPVLEALVKAIGLAKIVILNFAVSRLASWGLSAFSSVQPEFSGHSLTHFDFRGLFTTHTHPYKSRSYPSRSSLSTMPRTPKTRGRTRKYDTPKDKAKQDVVAKRNRRRLQKQAAHGNIRFQIYVSAQTEALPTTPSQGIGSY